MLTHDFYRDLHDIKSLRNWPHVDETDIPEGKIRTQTVYLEKNVFPDECPAYNCKDFERVGIVSVLQMTVSIPIWHTHTLDSSGWCFRFAIIAIFMMRLALIILGKVCGSSQRNSLKHVYKAPRYTDHTHTHTAPDHWLNVFPPQPHTCWLP